MTLILILSAIIFLPLLLIMLTWVLYFTFIVPWLFLLLFIFPNSNRLARMANKIEKVFHL